MHICVSKLTIIDSDNGLSPGRRQTNIWTNAGILLIGPLWTNFSEILIGIKTFSFKKMHLNMSSAKWRPFCLSLNVLNYRSMISMSDLLDPKATNGFLQERTSNVENDELQIIFHFIKCISVLFFTAQRVDPPETMGLMFLAGINTAGLNIVG